MSSAFGRRCLPLILAALAAAVAPLSAGAASYETASWTMPQAPFRIVGNIYYVGTRGLAVYLITSDKGHVLLDGGVAEDAPLIEENIRRLGFRLRDVKILLNNHAHLDHAGGLAQLRRDTGARLWASAGDRWALEHGRHRGDNTSGSGSFPAVRVDRVVTDGQTLRLGSIAMTAVLTPGHTPGCTTWTTPVSERGRALEVAFPCSLTVAGNVLVGNKAYPGIADDYRRTFAKLDELQADVVLTGHPEIADVLGRHRRQARGERNAFIDRTELGTIVNAARVSFERALQSPQPQGD
jgi:metallo-beta-lactamase class B